MSTLQIILMCSAFLIIGFLIAFLIFNKKGVKNKEVEKQAFTDPLTGGKNRHLFMYDLDKLIEKNKKFAICFMDLDGFKQINDTMGHDAGDELLIGLSNTFKTKLPKNVVSYRIGGDEFSLIITDIKTTEDITKILDDLRRNLNEPFIIQNTSIALEYSLGIAIFPEDARTKKELVTYADDAMYYIKEHGKNDYYFHNKALKAKLENSTKMEKELKSAFEKQEFGINFQPRINVKDKTKLCFEALLYWKHPVLGEISSEYFLKQAEEMSLIIKLDSYVLRLSCEKLKEIQKKFPNDDISIAVNLSNTHVKRKSFVEGICNIINEYNIKKGALKLQFTDDIDINKISEYKYLFEQVKNVGADVVINNLQIKYSSLILIKSLPIDEIKISSKYLLKESPIAKDALKNIVSLCNELGYMPIIKEVETKEELEYIKDLNINYIQGNLISKKLAFNELCEYIANK